MSTAWVATMALLLVPLGDGAGYPIQVPELKQVDVKDTFWLPRLRTNCQVTVWHDFRQCEQTGRIANFAVAAGLQQGGFQGIFFNDSDVFKAIEGASWCLVKHPDQKLAAYLKELVALIAAAQEEDGYLYTARTINDPNYNYPGREGRWSHLASGHELYNVGHLYEAAVAYWQATGDTTLLDVARKNADLVCRVFGSGPDQRVDVPGHQEIEIGLVKLYLATGDEKYLRQAEFFLEMRGRQDRRPRTYGPYCQDHLPVAQQEEAVGHAVRAGYMYAAMTDLAALRKRQDYRQSLHKIWHDVVTRKMYLTGGVGARAQGEAFGKPYELPNESAYNETCAAIAQMLWQQRLFLLEGDARFVDVLERILYNGFLAGVGMSGDRFFYPNPLACNGRTPFNHGTLGRSPWFSCACCPVNVVRILPQIPQWIYAQRDRNVYVNLYVQSAARLDVEGTGVTIRQETRYPWEGRVRITVEPQGPVKMTLRLRIPCWVHDTPLPGTLYRFVAPPKETWKVAVNGRTIQSAELVDGYAILDRQWNPGDTVTVALPVETRLVTADPRVQADRGRVALVRGPLVYCVEAVDNGGSVYDLLLPGDAELGETWEPDLLGGVVCVTARGFRLQRTRDGLVEQRPVAIKAIPYYAWAHREVGEMLVWIARQRETARPRPLPTLASLSRPSTSHCWPNDTVTALNDQIEPENSIDHSIPRHTFWDHRGTTEWVQYDFPEARTVRGVAVYWFDDTGRGHCRVPESWQILYRQGGQWVPVNAHQPYGTAKDQYNEVTFDPITTDGLRLKIQLQPGYSAGILEWKVVEGQ